MKCSLLLLLAVLGPGLTMAQSIDPIVSEDIIEAPIDRVWHAWTTTAGLKAWLAPHVDTDFRVGGLMRTNYDPNG